MPAKTLTRGAIVTKRRAARSLSQEALARLLGCSLRTVQRVESDANAALTEPLIEALHRTLGIPYRSLVARRKGGSS